MGTFWQRILLLVITVPFYLSLFGDLQSQFMTFANASSRECSNALFYFFGMVHGFVCWVLYLSYNCICDIVSFLVDRWYQHRELKKEAAHDSAA